MTIPMEEALKIKEIGNTHFKEKRYQEAAEVYLQAIDLDPSNATLFCNAATSFYHLGRFELVIQMADQALVLCPTMTKAVYRKGLALAALGLWKGAAADLRRVVKAVPGDLEAKSKLEEVEKEVSRAGFANAIRKDEFELEWKCISAIEVEETYTGPHITDGVTKEFCMTLMDYYKKSEGKLHLRYLYEVMWRAKLVLQEESTCAFVDIQVGQQMTICGDVHGQFFDLLKIFELNGYPSDQHIYLFNGDFVDRGSYSTEVITTLLALKCAYPASFYLTRGNHESETVNRVYGFYEELMRKYSTSRLFTLFSKVLNCLPLAFVVDRRFFVVHGGLPEKPDFHLDDLAKINRFVVPENGTLMSQLLWSDPQPVCGYAPSHRGEGVLFGPDVTADFLARNKLQKIIRSHVWEQTGYKEEHASRCITIFSAPNYSGSISPAAFINIGGPGEDIQFVQFEAAEWQGRATKPRPAPVMY